MKVGVFTVLYSDMPFEKALDHVKEMGCEAVEIGTGGYPGKAHCEAGALLKDEAAQRRLLRAVEKRGLIISALSCHGNPVHPQQSQARKFHDDWRKTVRRTSTAAPNASSAFLPVATRRQEATRTLPPST